MIRWVKEMTVRVTDNNRNKLIKLFDQAYQCETRPNIKNYYKTISSGLKSGSITVLGDKPIKGAKRACESVSGLNYTWFPKWGKKKKKVARYLYTHYGVSDIGMDMIPITDENRYKISRAIAEYATTLSNLSDRNFYLKVSRGILRGKITSIDADYYKNIIPPEILYS